MGLWGPDQKKKIDATFHAAQNLIYALYNPAPEKPLSKLGNGHNEALSTPAEIFSRASPPVIPMRVLIREVIEEKPKEVNKERVQLKNSSKTKPSTNSEHLIVSILESYPEELQPVNPAKNGFFRPIRSENLVVISKNEEFQNENWRGKGRYTRSTNSCDPRSRKNAKK